MGVSFLYFGKIPQLNGAATFFFSLLENKLFFEKELDEEINFFYLRTDGQHSLLKAKSSKIKSSLRTMLTKKLCKTFLGSLVYLYIFYQKNAKRVIKNYLLHRNCRNREIVVFNDIFVGFEALGQKCLDFSNSVLILHNDGNPLNMLESTLPQLRSYKMLRARLSSLLENISRIVLLSEKAKDNFIRLFPEYSEKTVVINNGVKLIESKVPNPLESVYGKIIGITIGTVCRRKGYDLLFNAMQELPRVQQDKIIIFCLGNLGDDIDLSACPENIVLLDGVEHNLLSSYFACADFFLMCSRDEGVPLSILEAMQFGLPIFSTDVGAISDIINSNGLLFRPDVDDIKKILQSIIENKYDLDEFARCSRENYKNYYSLETMIKRYVLLIKDLKNEQ